jgi:hypothetical protein
MNYILDQYVSTQVGEPYRLLPFGEIKRGGTTRIVTPESAAKMKLPPFKPPIKLGSHNDETPAGGHIVKLEVREDGLYAYPEFTEKGMKAIQEGDYKYHSPEIIWEDGALETAEGIIEGSLILGDALLHTPYLGEATAFYTTSVIEKESQMQENVSIPKSLFEQLMSFFKPNEEKPETPVTETAEYKAEVQKREDYRAQLEALQAENKTKELKASLISQLQNKEDYGAVYVELSKADEAASMLSSMSDEQRTWVMQNFKALTAQIDESALNSELGKETQKTDPNANPRVEFDAFVQKEMKEKNINYVEAFNVVKEKQADLFKAAFSK